MQTSEESLDSSSLVLETSFHQTSSSSTSTTLTSEEPNRNTHPFYLHQRPSSDTRLERIDNYSSSVHKQHSSSSSDNVAHSNYTHDNVAHGNYARKDQTFTDQSDKSVHPRTTSSNIFSGSSNLITSTNSVPSQLGKVLGPTDWSLPASLDECLNTIMVAGRISETKRSGVRSRICKLADYAVTELTNKGYSGVSRLLGDHFAQEIFQHVQHLYNTNLFQPGEHAQEGEKPVRSDMIAWIGHDDLEAMSSPGLRLLLSFLDAIVLAMGNRLEGKLLRTKTRAMVACYPGKDTGYDKHFDNPSVLSDGRYLTCIYYLNPNWVSTSDGGSLVLWPTGIQGNLQEVTLAPLLDRAVFFYADERTLHQVLPAKRDRFALTVWYFDQAARQRYWTKKYLEHQSVSSINRTGP